MEVLILSELQAIDKVKNLTVPTSVISITCPLDDLVIFEENNYLKDIFRLQFNDMEVPFKDFDIPRQNDFDGLKDFVDNLNCELLIIHCYAGVSRSAGVAGAVCQYLGIDKNIFDSKNYDPNLLVYKLACNELGIKPIKYFKKENCDVIVF